MTEIEGPIRTAHAFFEHVVKPNYRAFLREDSSICDVFNICQSLVAVRWHWSERIGSEVPSPVDTEQFRLVSDAANSLKHVIVRSKKSEQMFFATATQLPTEKVKTSAGGIQKMEGVWAIAIDGKSRELAPPVNFVFGEWEARLKETVPND